MFPVGCFVADVESEHFVMHVESPLHHSLSSLIAHTCFMARVGISGLISVQPLWFGCILLAC